MLTFWDNSKNIPVLNKAVVAIFKATYGKIWALFISKSGHTAAYKKGTAVEHILAISRLVA